MSIELLVNPIDERFFQLLKQAKDSIIFSSPFIKSSIAKEIVNNKPSNLQLSIVTAYKLGNFHRGASDLQALKIMIENDAKLKNLTSLHAKTYIFDNDTAIVTSGNLTLGGLRNNYECGVLIQNDSVVSEIRKSFTHLLSAPDLVSTITSEIIDVTENILKKVPKEKRRDFKTEEKELLGISLTEVQDDLYDGGLHTISDTLSGWRLDVFNILSRIQTNVFKLEHVYENKKNLQKLHPKNRNIEAKIRQQLQELRDLGLIEFLGRGVYRKLWKNE